MSGPISWQAARPFLALAALWALIHVLAVVSGFSSVLDGELKGPDSYMRLVRVDALWSGGGWFDNLILDSNVPLGDTLHWTRPFDVLILLGGWVLEPFLGHDRALFWSGSLTSPLLQLGALFAMAWATRPLLGRRGSWLAMLVLLAQPAVMFNSLAGRADHHSLQLLLLVVGIGFLVRALARPGSEASVRALARPGSEPGANPAAGRAALFAGVVAGLSVWVAAESLVWVTLAAAVLGFAWLRDGESRLRSNVRFGAGLWGALALALVLERPLSDILTIEYDRLSVVHLGIATALLSFWLALWLRQASWAAPIGFARGGTRERGLVGAGGGMLGIAALLAAFPGIRAGPFAELDPRLDAVFFERVSELTPLLPSGAETTGDFLFFVGSGLVVLPMMLGLAWRRRRETDWAIWLLLAGLLAVFFGLALQHVRIAPFAEVPLAIGVSLLLLRAHRRIQSQSNELVRTFGAFWLASLLLAGLPVLGLSVPTLGAHDPGQANESQIPAGCDLQAAAAHLNGPHGLGDEPRVILASIFYGSELLYRTDHKVLTGPYHRNDAAILDTYDALTTPDDSVALSIVERREVDIVLLCPSQEEVTFFSSSAGDTSLRERLLRGEAPAWLTPIAVPETVGIQLWEVTS